MYYLVVIKTLSSGSIEKTITSYDNKDTCLRKFHEAFNVIGGGPKEINALLLNVTDIVSLGLNGVEMKNHQVVVEKNESWVAPSEPEQE